MPKTMTALDFDDPQEVSAVDRGANKKKRFPIWKTEGNLNMDEILKNVIEQALENEDELEAYIAKAELSDKGKAAVTAAMRILSGFKDELPADVMTKLSGLSGMAAPEEKKKETTVSKTEETKTSPVAKALEGLPEEIKKALDAERAEQAAQIEALQKNNEAITKALEDEKDARELAGWLDKAKTDLSHYPGESSEEIAKTLHALHKVNPGLAEQQFGSMKKASDALKTSGIFKAAGDNGDSDKLSAWEEIEKLADGIVEKSADINITKAQAINQVLKTEKGRALYKRYEDEK